MANKLSLAAIETAKENLEAMPAAAKETRQVTLKEAIKTLSPTIRKLLRRGYSRTMVVDLLREQGVNVSLSTLKQYFREKVTHVDDRELEPSSTSTAEAAPQLASTKSGGVAALASSTSVAGLRRAPAA
jgi:hypothetical protein